MQLLFLLCADIASKVKVGQTEFKRYPENLLNSRVRYGRAFQVNENDSAHHSAVFLHCKQHHGLVFWPGLLTICAAKCLLAHGATFDGTFKQCRAVISLQAAVQPLM